MRLHFWKLCGAGNDFVALDKIKEQWETDSYAELAKKVCHRRVSIGADGLIIMEPSPQYDFRMRHFNPDGSEAETCGNGARSIAWLAYLRGIAAEQMEFETGAGVYSARVDQKNARVALRLALPREIRLGLNPPVEEREFPGGYVDLGVPHFVTAVEEVESMDVNHWGRLLRHHQEFPRGVNVNFMKVVSPHSLVLRTYERGVEEETLACGTGSVSSALVATLQGWVTPPVSVRTRGGYELLVEFELKGQEASNLVLSGPAELVFEGFLEL